MVEAADETGIALGLPLRYYIARSDFETFVAIINLASRH